MMKLFLFLIAGAGMGAMVVLLAWLHSKFLKHVRGISKDYKEIENGYTGWVYLLIGFIVAIIVTIVHQCSS
jgi:hypothetical protein